ncbi:Yos1-like protein [Sphaerosporella brunnea]|uniref:Yos1-like protein n=1 Tax=Sphaerosporella brunnea TaxID=1250544 RepID=A0A5J5EKH5_9PEZI|nr:Yos1-like protein [Sphaerosporella brunnea]
MFFGLMPLIKMIVLIINAIAILSEDRFLARIGWAALQPEPAFGAGGQDVSIKGKIVNLISATRLLTRIPLIGVNSVIIIYELLLG